MQKTFEIGGPIELELSLTAGDIEVAAGTDGKAEVELVAHDAESQELVDNATVEMRGNTLVVDVPEKRGFKFSFRSRGITCTVRCPEGSSLRSRTKSGDVDVSINLARADVATASGDVTLRDVSGDASVKTASGDTTVGDVGGRASVNSASGDVSIGRVAGDVNANTASGDITVDAAGGGFKANSASGDISIEASGSGDISINSASGDIGVGLRRGTRAHLDCNTVSGDTRSELDLSGDEPNGNGPLVHIKARTVSGDIHIYSANAQEVQA
ncbi:MAG TPA: DUF4097 family beta strand repeat-containing protein [Gaiellaceae bacterium]|jgi:DUF4097 and DUF4098 domain-containing protein YvlB